VEIDRPLLLETQIHDFVEKNIASVLGHGATVIKREAPVTFGAPGAESETAGRIDLLCRCPKGDTVAIEIKRGVADRHAVAQLLSYMGELRRSDSTRHVRGVLVAAGVDGPADAALAAIADIDVVVFEIRFLFKPLISRPSTRPINGASLATRTPPATSSRSLLSSLPPNKDFASAKLQSRYCVYCNSERLMESSPSGENRCRRCGNFV